MSEFRIATRYAKSLLELAEEKGVLDKVNEDMITFDHLCKANRDFALMLKNPIIQHHRKLAILKKIFAGKVHDLTLSIFDIITRKNREFILPMLASEFTHLYNVRKGISEATVTTNFALTPELRKEFMRLLKEITKKEIELTEKVDKEMLGGYIIKVGDLQLDDSVDSRLKDLKTKLISSSYIKKF
jgi:F-type H+-transporting ATPase subunit delta